MSNKSIMHLTAIASVLCAVWAWFIPAYAMALAMIVNAIFSFVMAIKWN